MKMKRIVAVFLLIAAFSAAFGCGRKTTAPQGENVILSVKTNAAQSRRENYAELSYEIWVSFDRIDVGESLDNTILLNGEPVAFRTDAFASDTAGSERIYAGKVNVKRQEGQSLSFPIEVFWYRVGGKSSDEYYRTCRTELILDDSTVRYYEGEAETKPSDTVPPETKPAETIPPETKAPETKASETLPPETHFVETDPVETKPEDDPVTPGPKDDDPEAFTSWDIRSDTGTYLNVVAKCSAAEIAGGYRIRVTLYLEHSSIFVGSRTGGALKIAGQSFPYTTPTIEREDDATVLTRLTSAEATVKRGEVFTVSANYPFNGVYGGVPISEILIEGKYVFE